MIPPSSFVWVPVLAGLCVVALHLAALRLYPRWDLLDFPERYGLTRKRIPYPTGAIALLTFLGFFLALNRPDEQSMGLLFCIALLGAFCFVDDRRPLPPVLRLGVQAGVAVVLFATGTRIYSLTNPLPNVAFGRDVPLDLLRVTIGHFGTFPLLSGLFTILWLGLTINALNWFDGIPGQVTTLSTIGFLTIGLLSLSARVNQPLLALLSFTLAGIAAGSLLFDFPPPKVVLGDTGAMFFGLMLGVLTIYAGGKVATAFLVLGVPLVDLVLVVIRRLWRGKSPLRGSAAGEHLHHRLLAKGWSPQQVILLTAAIGSLFGSTALFLDTFQKFIAAFVLLLVMVALSWYSQPTKRR